MCCPSKDSLLALCKECARHFTNMSLRWQEPCSSLLQGQCELVPQSSGPPAQCCNLPRHPGFVFSKEYTNHYEEQEPFARMLFQQVDGSAGCLSVPSGSFFPILKESHGHTSENGLSTTACRNCQVLSKCSNSSASICHEHILQCSTCPTGVLTAFGNASSQSPSYCPPFFRHCYLHNVSWRRA